MKHRILLVTKKPGARRSSTRGLDISNLATLSVALRRVGATRVVRYWRDRIGDSHVEGTPFAVEALSEKDLAWLIAAPKDNARALYYETAPAGA